ncbi:hypothetical protein PAPYR_5482 [Paratrimastix pyriformis]|uniref:Right handed beta helix domain-containing protein n=1 Tax=Paratrimastix pyriformis TaxID=342808 RepID=A0ABQ8ULA3_9EUKA|nr:hypothetical protein PAPYR_5482 [Paratrimastix pyriformis]
MSQTNNPLQDKNIPRVQLVLRSETAFSPVEESPVLPLGKVPASTLQPKNGNQLAGADQSLLISSFFEHFLECEELKSCFFSSILFFVGRIDLTRYQGEQNTSGILGIAPFSFAALQLKGTTCVKSVVIFHSSILGNYFKGKVVGDLQRLFNWYPLDSAACGASSSSPCSTLHFVLTRSPLPEVLYVTGVCNLTRAIPYSIALQSFEIRGNVSAPPTIKVTYTSSTSPLFSFTSPSQQVHLSNIKFLVINQPTTPPSVSLDSAFYIASEGGSLSLDSVTFTSWNRALYLSDLDQVAITSCTFSSNVAADDGGAVYAENCGLITLNGGTFMRNKAGHLGGALIAKLTGPEHQGTIRVHGTRFKNNEAYIGGALGIIGYTFEMDESCSFSNCNSDMGAGSLYLEMCPQISVSDATFSMSQASSVAQSAAVTVHTKSQLAAQDTRNLLVPAPVSFTRCRFMYNQALSGSGALTIYNADEAPAWLLIDQCFFQLNTAESGAGLMAVNGNLTVRGTTFLNNIGLGFGGDRHDHRGSLHGFVVGPAAGLYANMGSNITIDDCDFRSNTAISHGAGPPAHAPHAPHAPMSMPWYLTGAPRRTSREAHSGGGMDIALGGGGDHDCWRLPKVSSQAQWGGGGILLNYVLDSEIVGSYFESNTAQAGGAIYLQGTERLALRQLVVPIARTTGGAFAILSSNCDIYDSTIAKNSVDMVGGGIFFQGYNTTYNCFLKLSNVTVVDNVAHQGGALSADTAVLDVDGCTFMDNEVHFEGGALEFKLDVGGSIRNTLFVAIHFSSLGLTRRVCSGRVCVIWLSVCADSNQAGTLGGALAIAGEGTAQSQPAATGENPLLIEACLFLENQAQMGGALSLREYSNVTLSRSNFTRNSNNPGEGGAICARVADVTLTECIFEGNSGTNGGAIFAYNSSLIASRTSFYRNAATVYGGGLYLSASKQCALNELRFENGSRHASGGPSTDRHHARTGRTSLAATRTVRTGRGTQNSSHRYQHRTGSDQNWYGVAMTSCAVATSQPVHATLCTFALNKATDKGSSIALMYNNRTRDNTPIEDTRLVHIDRSIITEGQGNQATALYLYRSDALLSLSSLLANGLATSQGGAVVLEESSLTVTDSRVSGNVGSGFAVPVDPHHRGNSSVAENLGPGVILAESSRNRTSSLLLTDQATFSNNTATELNMRANVLCKSGQVRVEGAATLIGDEGSRAVLCPRDHECLNPRTTCIPSPNVPTPLTHRGFKLVGGGPTPPSSAFENKTPWFRNVFPCLKAHLPVVSLRLFLGLTFPHHDKSSSKAASPATKPISPRVPSPPVPVLDETSFDYNSEHVVHFSVANPDRADGLVAFPTTLDPKCVFQYSGQAELCSTRAVTQDNGTLTCTILVKCPSLLVVSLAPVAPPAPSAPGLTDPALRPCHVPRTCPTRLLSDGPIQPHPALPPPAARAPPGYQFGDRVPVTVRIPPSVILLTASAASAALLMILVLLFTLVLCWRKWRTINKATKAELSSLLKSRISGIDVKGLVLVERIGSGATGVVYRGRLHGAHVAVKQVYVRGSEEEQRNMQSEFKREVVLMQSAQPHPHPRTLHAHPAPHSARCIMRHAPHAVPTHWTHALDPRTVPTHCTHALYPCTGPMHRTHALYPRTVPTHCTHALYPRTVPTHCTHALYPRTVPTHCTHALYPRTTRTLVSCLPG